MNAMVNLAMKQYRSVGVNGGIAEASSHRLIQMLMEGALDKIASAKGNMERNEIAKKGENISLAITIVNVLQSSLDLDKGGEIASNLQALYDYITRCLLDANANNSREKLNEVTSLILEIKGAWDAIPDEYKNLPED